MVRGIMLNKLSNIVSENLSVMGSVLFLSWPVESLFSCSANYGGKSRFLSIILIQLIPNVAVIVVSDGNFLIFN